MDLPLEIGQTDETDETLKGLPDTTLRNIREDSWSPYHGDSDSVEHVLEVARQH